MTDYQPRSSLVGPPIFASRTRPALGPVPRPRLAATSLHPRWATVTLPGRSHNRDTPMRARAYVRDFLREWHVPEVVVEVLTLAVSEFATNALTHVNLGTVDVRVSVTEDEAVVSVTDRGLSRRPVVLADTGSDDEHGRGLALVKALTDRLEVLADQESTEVLAAVALPSHARDTCKGGADDDDAPRAHG